MNDTFECKLVSLLPQSEAVAVPPMVIETIYHGPRSYDLLLLNSSYENQPLEHIIGHTLFGVFADSECEYDRSEQVDFLAWHLTPIFAEQFSWLQVPGGEWSRFMGADLSDAWFNANTRYCVSVQAFDRDGREIGSKLAWVQIEHEETAAEEIVDLAYRLDAKEAVMFTYGVFKPQLAAAFSVLRPHPALKTAYPDDMPSEEG